jgi:hypothetical protein
MKNHIYILFILAIVGFISCSVEDQLDESIQLEFNAKAMNTVEFEPLIALDRGYFSVRLPGLFRRIHGLNSQ